MTRRRRTLGGRLARWIAAATAVCLVLFAAIAGTIWWLVEDSAHADDVVFAGDESMREELFEQMALAIGIAAPLGIATTMLAARWLTRRATARIDAVVATAAQVDARDLSARLPVSDAGDELDALSDALNKMFARIDLGVAGQRQFAADASHELRTPLTAVRGLLEVARLRPRTADDWERTADRALGELDRMSALVDALIQLARADTANPDKRPVAIGDAIHRVCDAVAPRAAERGIRVVATVPPELVAVGDAGGVEIALTNLIANAITHSPDGGEVSVAAVRNGAEVRIDVDDRGPGVPAAVRDRIFEPFTRGDAASADRVAGGAGVGLGLAIARRIAIAQAGGIDVGDAPAGGARFTLRLPAGQLSPDAARARG